MKMLRKGKYCVIAACLFLAGCGYPETEFVARGTQLVLTGVIDGTTLGSLQQARAENPSANVISLLSVPGSADDENSLEKLTRYIRTEGLRTVVPANGLVASGGTDMALMGRGRVIEPGACIGVHSWAAGAFGLTLDTGAELPRNAPEHQLYLEFYREIGIPEAFYWFTLTVAGPDDVHWMSPQEINRFRLSDVPVPASSETAAQREERCFNRLP